MPEQFSIKVHGARKLSEDLLRFRETLTERGFMLLMKSGVADYLAKITSERFQTQTNPHGGRWRPLSPAYLASEHKRASRFPKAILRDTGSLWEALRGNPKEKHSKISRDDGSFASPFFDFDAAGFEWGVEDEVAAMHQIADEEHVTLSGKVEESGLPIRAFLGLDDEHMDKVGSLVLDRIEEMLSGKD